MEKNQNKKYTIYSIVTYKGITDDFIKNNGISFLDLKSIKKELKNDKGYHFRIQKNTNYIFFGDIDHYKKSINNFIKSLQSFLLTYYNLKFETDEFKYTTNNEKTGSFHYSIPKWNASTKKLKEIHDNLKNYIGEQCVDTSIYSNHWFRCPNQKKGDNINDTSKHIIAAGSIEDFIITYIPKSSTSIENMQYNDEYDEKPKKIKKDKKNNALVVKDIIVKQDDNQNNVIIKNDDIDQPQDNKKNELVLSKTMTQPVVIKKVIDCYKQQRYDEYNCWVSIGMALKNSFVDDVAFELFDYFSSKGKKYDGTEKTKEKFKSFGNFGFLKALSKKTQDGYTMATIYYFAVEDNKPKFIEIMKKNTFDLEQYDICKYVKILAGNKFLYIKEGDIYKLYCYNGKQWENDDTLFKQFVSTELYDFLKFLLVELYFDDNSFNQMRNQIKKLKTTKFKKEMVETYKELNTQTDIKFDNKWNLFGFKNFVYDLESGQFRDYEYNDYISTTAGYDWVEPTQEDINTVDNLISEIMPIKEEKELYLQILSTTLDGKCLEHFIIFNGCGGNGKGMINDLLLCALGDYAMIGNNSILFEASKTGSNPEKANIHKKRLVLFREPPENKKFENSIIKELTGGGTFSARGHHESNTKKELNLTMIVEANKKPLFAEEPTNADVRRIVDVVFRSSYTQNKDLVNKENNIYLANTYYKTPEFQNKYKCALLKILMEAYKKHKEYDYKLKIPKTIEERTSQYLELSCNILQWFKDNYELTNNEENICKMKDLYDDFSSSTYFHTLTKNEKRKYNKSYFNDYVTTNNFFMKYHKERSKVGNIRNCIVGWRRINNDNDE